jgi:homoserine kinase type II
MTRLDPVSGGVENSHYFASSDRGEFVLTLFERADPKYLISCLDALKAAAYSGLPVPRPVASLDGSLLRQAQGKPMAVFHKIEGASPLEPTPLEAAQIGFFLGAMHSLHMPEMPEHPRSKSWIESSAAIALPHIEVRQRQLIARELKRQHEGLATIAAAKIPRGFIHADLFRDNALFLNGKLSGVLDFYFSGQGHFMFDLATAVNDWTFDESGLVQREGIEQALIKGYLHARPAAQAEMQWLAFFKRQSSLRFWLSRLLDFHLPRAGALTHTLDPVRFENILSQLSH